MTFRLPGITPLQRPAGSNEILTRVLAAPLVLLLGASGPPVGSSVGNGLPNRAVVSVVNSQPLGSPLALLAGAPIAAPFFVTDWPNPKGPLASIGLRTHLDPLKLNLLGQDAFFGAAGQAPAHLDWPNPRGAQAASDLRTFNGPLNLALVTLPQVAPPTNYDWPVPKGYLFGIGLRTHLDPLRLNLIGQDTFFGGPGQPPAHLDWPNPRGPLAIGAREWTRGLSALNLQVTAAPFALYDWPVPRGASGSIVLRTSTQPGISTPVVLPTLNYDWPNPRGAVYPVSIRGSVLPSRVNLIGQDSFFYGAGRGPVYDWPNPRGKPFALSLRVLLDPLKILYPAGIFEPGPRIVVVFSENRIVTVGAENRLIAASEPEREVTVPVEGRSTEGS